MRHRRLALRHDSQPTKSLHQDAPYPTTGWDLDALAGGNTQPSPEPLLTMVTKTASILAWFVDESRWCRVVHGAWFGGRRLCNKEAAAAVDRVV